MWFPLLFVSNTLICRQVSVYASPPELVKQTYMSMTTSPVLWAKRDLNPRLPRYQRGTLTIWVTCPLNTIPINEHPWKLYFLWTRRESNPPLSPCKGETPALEHASPNTHLKYDKFKELCAFGGIEPTHIWPLLIYIVSSCILSLDVKPTCTEQLQSPIYCDKPAFIFCTPAGIRTQDPQLRRLLLWSTELRRHLRIWWDSNSHSPPFSSLLQGPMQYPSDYSFLW